MKAPILHNGSDNVTKAYYVEQLWVIQCEKNNKNITIFFWVWYFRPKYPKVFDILVIKIFSFEN